MVASSDHIENKKVPVGSVALLLTVSTGGREISLAQPTRFLQSPFMKGASPCQTLCAGSFQDRHVKYIQ